MDNFFSAHHHSIDAITLLASSFLSMTKTQFRLGVGALFALILLINITSPNRYKTTLFSDKLVMKTDGSTGKVWFYTKENGWIPLLGSNPTKPNE